MRDRLSRLVQHEVSRQLDEFQLTKQRVPFSSRQRQQYLVTDVAAVSVTWRLGRGYAAGRSGSCHPWLLGTPASSDFARSPGLRGCCGRMLMRFVGALLRCRKEVSRRYTRSETLGVPNPSTQSGLLGGTSADTI